MHYIIKKKLNCDGNWSQLMWGLEKVKEQWVRIVKVLYPWFEINWWSLMSCKIAPRKSSLPSPTTFGMEIVVNKGWTTNLYLLFCPWSCLELQTTKSKILALGLFRSSKCLVSQILFWNLNFMCRLKKLLEGKLDHVMSSQVSYFWSSLKLQMLGVLNSFPKP
jgi:hypothetical protein